ncbi:bifunctional phosphoribosyl-AMP cyclohydrolase/phosphoribosyl-ATP diphosphatase [Idiomarina tyrosinivorans]|uniref:Histidine biosynthesis bifunctional protein HisIE n=1 Tax=Idiomarina tyrosinivorans TaxID=1445662 RepID=A0A432ZLA2_9GAMM|nr:bifunctional phosphoribosyl-AMP cyclohydrolase/phosphoribosyl-ATP diphosphatase HisIE [Idiomarina tyrosinivorans]RUO78756.1 bifunctional phosphoribosyl-AMP cyclohydrolase/phosphoribosyl-ATP diphosphatase [Idiomarina tyrosinivorans]
MQVTLDNYAELAWQKMQQQLPCIVQDSLTGTVLMQGYVTPEAVAETLQSGWVTFFSRSKQRLWTKGEQSGNRLQLVSLHSDCDNDSLLALVEPLGPTCHLGTNSCFAEASAPLLQQLEQTIVQRQQQASSASYTAKLLQQGINKVAQKVGEEGVEVALAAVAEDRDALLNESADLLFHLLLALRARDCELKDVLAVLAERRR